MYRLGVSRPVTHRHSFLIGVNATSDETSVTGNQIAARDTKFTSANVRLAWLMSYIILGIGGGLFHEGGSLRLRGLGRSSRPRLWRVLATVKRALARACWRRGFLRSRRGGLC